MIVLFNQSEKRLDGRNLWLWRILMPLEVSAQLHRAGAGRMASGVPNKTGGMNFPYPEPGWYMVMATYRRPDPQQA
jgi:hypothetical protein